MKQAIVMLALVGLASFVPFPADAGGPGICVPSKGCDPSEWPKITEANKEVEGPDFGPHPPQDPPASLDDLFDVDVDVEACETPVGGLWGNPLEPGRGYAIDVQGDTIVVTGFGYTFDGQPSWWQLAGLLRELEACILTVRATVYYHYGGPAWYEPYRGTPDPRPDEIAELVFYAPDSATIEYKGLILDISRQLFGL